MRDGLPEGNQCRFHSPAEPELPGCGRGTVRLKLLVLVALGGAVGAVARYGVGGWIHGLVGSSFPWGTLAVNLVGSFALGFAIRTLHASTVAPEFRGFLTIGLFGAFTTFSTFSYEAVTLLQDGEWARASAYLFGSVAAGVAAVIAGLWLASLTLHARA